jgi:cation-transporting ATPase I
VSAFLPHVLTLSTQALLGILPDPVRKAIPGLRGVRPAPGGLRIDLRKIGSPGTEEEARLLEERLREVEGVERAEVNGTLGCVFVGFDPSRFRAPEPAGAEQPPEALTLEMLDIDKLLSIVEEFDIERDQAHVSSAAGLVEQHARAIVRLGAGVAGAGFALAGRLVQVPVLPQAVPTLLNLVDSTPRFRAAVEGRIGRPATDALFTTSNIVAQTLALRPVALVIDSLLAVGRYVEAHAGSQALAQRERELSAREGAYRHIRSERGARPAPLPYGPVQRFADTMGTTALGAYGVTALACRSHNLALATLISASPKAARLGREAFASATGRALAQRGALVLRRGALRDMDRIDTVVLDAEAFTLPSWTIDRVVPIDESTDRDELHARLYSLIDLTDPAAVREQDGWRAEPVADLAAHIPAEAAEWEERGLRGVRVTAGGAPVALVGLAREIDPQAAAVAAAATNGCTVVLAGGDPGLARRLAVEEVVPGGPRLAESVTELQADGHGVALVSRHARQALVQADLGIGVLSRSGDVPWDADVAAEFDGVHLMLVCLSRARSTSERTVRLSTVGAAVGAALVFAGRPASSVRRALLVGDFTALITLAVGEWAGLQAGRTTPPARPDLTPWHAMTTRDVLSRLASSRGGISEEEAARRRAETKPVEVQGPASLVRASLEELANPLTPVLAGGAGISALVGSVLDAVLIAGVMLFNALVGGVQRFDADRALNRLSEATAVQVRLRRPDGTREVNGDDLVPGDVIELRAGDAVPADARLLKAVGLEVDESSLTGESQLVTKSPAPTAAAAVADRTSMVYQNTTVAAGNGLAVVVATGQATEAGRTAVLAGEPRPPTGVELRLRELGRRILPIALGSGAVLMVTDLLRGRPLSAALAPAVSLAVAAVPEGLPFVATVAELAAARRLSTRNTLVRNPSTIEALGRVDVLCFDKTGTLTEGRITLRNVSDGRVERPIEDLTPELRQIVVAGLRAGPRYGTGRAIAHPTDRAVIDGARRLGLAPDDGADSWERVDELPFEPGRGYHAVLGRGEPGQQLIVKGAPEVVLLRCTTMRRDGQIVPLDQATLRELEKEVDRLAYQGSRVLAVAERPASGRRDLDESRIEGLCFLGFLGLADSVRPTAAESVRRLTGAGVRVVMITGDHPSTAEAIAVKLGVLNGMRVMTGPELDSLDDDVLTKVLPDVAVFARATPAHKVRIVDCLRRAGSVVAVTGDGANDAPAIRMAEVGIALGSRATPAARAAADVVVTDDRIETIVDAIVEGRGMWGSVRAALSILLGGNLGEIAFTVGSSLLGGRSALNARQLLLVNLLTDMVPAMAVAVRPPAATSPERLLAEGPEASLGTSLTRDIYLRAATTAGAATVAWVLARMTGRRGRADTVGLVALVSAQLIQTLTAGSRDRVVVVASVASLAVLVMIVSVPGLSRFFGCRPIGPAGWAIGLGSAGASALVGAWLEPLTREKSSAVH